MPTVTTTYTCYGCERIGKTWSGDATTVCDHLRTAHGFTNEQIHAGGVAKLTLALDGTDRNTGRKYGIMLYGATWGDVLFRKEVLTQY